MDGNCAPPGRCPVHLAQFNIARAIAPLDAPEMRAFVAQLDAVNRAAESADGFVWRLRAGDEGYLSTPDDRTRLVNLSVWTSIEALRAFTYRGAHVAVVRERSAWFLPPAGPTYCLWWMDAGTLPTVDDGEARLAALAERGPSPDAFTFSSPFDPAGRLTRTAAPVR